MLVLIHHLSNMLAFIIPSFIQSQKTVFYFCPAFLLDQEIKMISYTVRVFGYLSHDWTVNWFYMYPVCMYVQ